jgi:peptidoglycan/LPS O-acetylase OafA/YrhL
MAEVAGPESQVHWGSTFGYILLPGLVAGGLLGWAESERRQGRRRSWAAFAPLAFTAILLTHFWQLPSIAEDGVGGGAIGVPLVGMLGGWAIARRGKRLSRAVAGALFVAGLVVWAFTATAVGGPTFALDTAHGLWLTSLYYALLLTLAVAASVPHQSPDPVEPEEHTLSETLPTTGRLGTH